MIPFSIFVFSTSKDNGKPQHFPEGESNRIAFVRIIHFGPFLTRLKSGFVLFHILNSNYEFDSSFLFSNMEGTTLNGALRLADGIMVVSRDHKLLQL